MSVWTVSVPGALVPEALAFHAAKHVPRRLTRALCRASNVGAPVRLDSTAPHLDCLWQHMGGSGSAVSAAYAWPLLTEAPLPEPGTLWLCAPAHFAMARDHVLIHTLDGLVADHGAIATLNTVANQVARAYGADIIQHQNQTFLHTQVPWQLETTPLDYAVGRSLTDCWPQGPDAGHWRKLLTEIQVAWHHHPINISRRDNDEPEINGLWIEGGGVSSGSPLDATYDTVVCDDVRIHGWAYAAGIPKDRLLRAGEMPPKNTNALFVLPELLSSVNTHDWGAWMSLWPSLISRLDALCTQALSVNQDVVLELFGQHSVRRINLCTRDRWRFWRSKPSAYMRTLFTERDWGETDLA